MKADIARRISPVVVMAALFWAAACRGQGLEIDIPVPEPSKTAEGKDAARRKPSQRAENNQAARDKQQAAKTPSAARTPKTRAEGSNAGSSGHSGWWNRWFQAGRRQPGQEESPPLVARRLRTTPQDHRDAPLAPPSPWDHGR